MKDKMTSDELFQLGHADLILYAAKLQDRVEELEEQNGDLCQRLEGFVASHEAVLVGMLEWTERLKAYCLAQMLQANPERTAEEWTQELERVLGRGRPYVEPTAWMHVDPEIPTVRFLEWKECPPGYKGEWRKVRLYALKTESEEA